MTADPRSVDGRRDTARFKQMGFDDFRELALDPTLSEIEKMGGAKGHREGFDDAIWTTILDLLPALSGEAAHILDIGPGCGGIARRMIALAERQRHRVTMIDHAEMLDQLPASDAVERIPGRFPNSMPGAGETYDVILAYSILHYVIVDANPFSFLDACLERLKPGGRLLVGDIPNFSKLRRFLASEVGAAFHREYMRTDDPPEVPPFAAASPDRIDDGALMGLVLRARLAGFDAYVLPQPPNLPLANRREDLLIVRP